MKSMNNRSWQLGVNLIMAIGAILALAPFLLMIIASFTEERWATTNGFSFFPGETSLLAYRYIAMQWSLIGRAYLMTLLVTLIGTTVSLLMTTMFAYGLSQDEMPGVRILNFLSLFTLLFSGGIVASFYVWVRIFGIRDTFWALVIPGLLMNGFTIILVKNYFKWSIPKELYEAARMDGAKEFRVFGQISLPLSLPILATIGLMTGLAYWNDWTNGLYYLTQRGGSQFFTIQLILNSINENLRFLTQNSHQLGSIKISDLPTSTIRMTIAVIGILPIMVLYPIFQKYFVKGITLGGVKG